MPDPGSVRLSRQDHGNVATGFASGERATPELAVAAVRQALEEVGSGPASSVLLFLTPHFQRHAQAAVTAVARSSRCLQVVGCTAPGVFTESQWSLDAPAAAALVLRGGSGLMPPTDGEAAVLTLLAAEMARRFDLKAEAPRYGVLSTDGQGSATGCVWSHGKVSTSGYCENTWSNARVAVGVSRGLRALSPVLSVDDSDGLDVLSLDGRLALATLVSALPTEVCGFDGLPLSHLFAAVPETDLGAEEALASGRYRLLPIIGASAEDQSVTMAAPLAPGERMFWLLRRPAAAEQDTGIMLDALTRDHTAPDFAVMFCCIGRGPYFFGGADRDLLLLGERFPDLPVVGVYGAGEIAPLPGGNDLISYSAVTALVSCVQP